MLTLDARQAALADLLSEVGRTGYRFVAVTPATHARVLNGPAAAACPLRRAFGWNLPFAADSLPPRILSLLRSAEAVEALEGGLLKSRIRIASLEGTLFCHSAFPTERQDSVFFGPDTYRFASMLREELPLLKAPRRLVDLGAGSGAGGIVAAMLVPGLQASLIDVNPKALRLAAVNARHAGVEVELLEGSGLDAVDRPVDLVVANPPYIMDEDERAYRDGGGMLGAQLSLDWALAAAHRLEPGGHMLLYTGVAVVAGEDGLRKALEQHLPALGCSLRYREIDPDIFGEELEKPLYRDVERIAAVAAVITKR